MLLKVLIKKAIFKFTPVKMRMALFHRLVLTERFEEKFIHINDSVSNSSFQMYMREDAWIEQRLYAEGLYGDWEKDSLKIWAELARMSQMIIDIGANTGVYSLLAQCNNASAIVIAIEPVDINHQILTTNIHINNYPVRVEKIAISNSEGIAKMFMLENRLNYMTSVNDDRYAIYPEIKGDAKVVEIEVPMRPFSFVVEKYKMDKVDLIKVDVEGHELIVIQSMVSYLKRDKPSILIEISGDDNAIAIDSLFRSIGYESFLSINENGKTLLVDNLWDNDHHNFLICNGDVIQKLRKKNLVQ